MLPWAAKRTSGAAGPARRHPACPAAADRPWRRRHGPRNQPAHAVFHGGADRRRPHRHLGANPRPARRRLLGPVVRHRDTALFRRPPTRPRARAAPIPSSSARPPRSRSQSAVRPARRRPSHRRPRRPPAWAISRPPRNSLWRRTSRPFSFPRRRPPPTPSGHRRPRSSRRASRPPSSRRAQWGADESVRCGNRPFDQPIRAAVVHHTAGSNDYSTAGLGGDRASRSTRTTPSILGWCDIAYNALVDKYGQVFEGRAGGLTGPVQGYHTGGFNGTAGVWR